MPRTRTARPRESKVDELLDAASALFGRDGFSGATTAQIAKAAQVSEKTIFWYFPSKDDLLLALVERDFGRILDGLRKAGWPRGELADDLYRLLRALRPLSHLLPAMHQRAEVSERIAEARRRFRTANRRFVAASLGSAHRAPRDVDDAATLVFSFADGILLRDVRDAQLRRLCRTVANALRSAPSSAAP